MEIGKWKGLKRRAKIFYDYQCMREIGSFGPFKTNCLWPHQTSSLYLAVFHMSVNFPSYFPTVYLSDVLFDCKIDHKRGNTKPQKGQTLTMGKKKNNGYYISKAYTTNKFICALLYIATIRLTFSAMVKCKTHQVSLSCRQLKLYKICYTKYYTSYYITYTIGK